MTGRGAAVRAVGRVLRSGAYSNRVIAAESAGLDTRDRRTAHRIGYGVLRTLLRLDRALMEHSARAPRHVQPVVWDVLRVGAWELLFGDVADAVAVDSAVETVREVGKPRAAGFVNAVLRALATAGEPSGLDRSVAMSMPEHLVTVLDRHWGRDRTDAFMAASNQDARLGLRARPPGIPAPSGLESTGITDSYLGGEVPDGWVVQDPASVAVGWAVGARPGNLVLDVAAAPGGKTVHLADLGAKVVGSDIHLRRLVRASQRTQGGLVSWLAADGCRLPFPDGTFDRILVDAPCSGLGVLRRRPEIRYRISETDIVGLARLQGKLLREAERVGRTGGTITYSVCTVTAQETVDVVAGPDWSAPEGLPGERMGNGLLLAPDTTATDGMFIAVRTLS